MVFSILGKIMCCDRRSGLILSKWQIWLYLAIIWCSECGIMQISFHNDNNFKFYQSINKWLFSNKERCDPYCTYIDLWIDYIPFAVFSWLLFSFLLTVWYFDAGDVIVVLHSWEHDNNIVECTYGVWWETCALFSE